MSENITKQKIYGLIHCHTTHSLKDSPLKIDDLVETAKSMGATAVTITDHGTCTGWFEFMRKCREEGINGIPGVEAYIKTKYSEKAHMILLAKNYDGFREISEAVSMANDPKNRYGEYPVMTWDILKKCFGNGNVIATTACIGGVIASTLLANDQMDHNANILRRKLDRKKIPDSRTYAMKKAELEEIDKKIDELSEKAKHLKALADKKYARRQKAVSSMSELTENEAKEKNKAKLALDAEMAESKDAAEKLLQIKPELATLKKKRSPLKGYMTKADKQIEQYNELKRQLEASFKNKYDKSVLESDAENELLMLKELFEDDFYVEMQYHGIPSEAYIYPKLAELAEKNNIPLCASNDVHIRTSDDAEARQVLMSLRFNKYVDMNDSDKELYIKTDDELKEWLGKILDKNTVKKAMAGTRKICDLCHVEVPKTTHYPKYRDADGNIVADSAALLKRNVQDGIRRKFPNGTFTEKYQKRIEHELDVIISMGYADYLLIVSDYIREGKRISQKKGMELVGKPIGYNVGPGRGSGAGCLANYLLDITVADPLKYNLKFERFLNRARVSMPDIDADFGDEVREETIAYVTKKYGAESVAGIRTVSAYAGKGAIKSAARFEGWRECAEKGLTPKKDEEADGIMKKWRNAGEKLAGAVEKSIAEDMEALNEFNDPMSRRIMETAPKIENTLFATGVHAAGIIIGDGTPLKSIVPLMYNQKKQEWATQCDMIDAEGLMKLLKMDFLGLNNLDILTDTIRDTYRHHGDAGLIDLDHLDLEDKNVYEKIFACGNTSCVFQFESSGMKKMLKEFKPSCFEDIVLLVAAYRPGPMDNIPRIISNKNGKTQPEYIVPSLKPILDPTYGVPVYQEQLMDIFHVCAGFTLEEADNIRKYMSKKKVDKFLAYKGQFIKGMEKSGAKHDEAEKFWDSLVSFASYGFNKSHAVAYGIISFQTAYLKCYYPDEYMCAVINHATQRKSLIPYINTAKECGIRILPPDINKSEVSFCVESPHNIRYGLSQIKNVSSAAEYIVSERKKNGYYESPENFLMRMKDPEFEGSSKVTSGAIESLIKAGCLDAWLNEKRTAAVKYVPDISDAMKKLETSKARCNKAEEEMRTAEDAKSRKKAARKIESEQNKVHALGENIRKMIDNIQLFAPDNRSVILEEERDLLGTYISGHPLESYSYVYSRSGCRHIDELEAGDKVFLCVIIRNLNIIKGRKDGRKMAFFTAEDMTGEISAGCYPNEYEELEGTIKEGQTVTLSGTVQKKKVFGNENEYELFFSVGSADAADPSMRVVIISAETKAQMNMIADRFSGTNSKLRVVFRNSFSGAIEVTDRFVSDDILPGGSDATYPAGSNPIFYPYDGSAPVFLNPPQSESENLPTGWVPAQIIMNNTVIPGRYRYSFITVHELSKDNIDEQKILDMIKKMRI